MTPELEKMHRPAIGAPWVSGVAEGADGVVPVAREGVVERCCAWAAGTATASARGGDGGAEELAGHVHWNWVAVEKRKTWERS